MELAISHKVVLDIIGRNVHVLKCHRLPLLHVRSTKAREAEEELLSSVKHFAGQEFRFSCDTALTRKGDFTKVSLFNIHPYSPGPQRQK